MASISLQKAAECIHNDLSDWYEKNKDNLPESFVYQSGFGFVEINGKDVRIETIAKNSGIKPNESI